VVDHVPLDRPPYPKPRVHTLTLLVGRITTIKLAYWAVLAVAEIWLGTRYLLFEDRFPVWLGTIAVASALACAWAAWSARATDRRLGGLERSLPAVATTFIAASVVATPASLPLLFIEIQRASEGCARGICHWEAVWSWVATIFIGTFVIPLVFALRMRRSDPVRP
jgi:hypothetical protein